MKGNLHDTTVDTINPKPNKQSSCYTINVKPDKRSSCYMIKTVFMLHDKRKT